MASSTRVWSLAAGVVAGLLLAAGALAAAASSAAVSLAAAATDDLSGGIHFRLVAGGFEYPLDIAVTGAVTDTRLFVVERRGRIRIVEPDGQVRATPFLSLTGKVQTIFEEEGLLSVAFAPDYAASGHFFVYYTNRNGDNQVSRFQVSADPNVAALTETVVLTMAHQPFFNHNGGDLNFGPDGLLYIAPGDGGGTNHMNSQDLGVLLGKVLRIDVNGAPTYTIPASNPFTQTAGARPEIWAVGLRNPWRFSFDAGTGDLYVADVGRELFEEINFQAAGAAGGLNYGWRCFEGPFDNSLPDCTITHTLPLFAYPHTLAHALVGGYVYRGQQHPAWQGQYFFADFVTGKFWTLNTSTLTVTEMIVPAGLHVSAFGQDAAGELYVADYATSAIYQLAPAKRLYLPQAAR